MCSYVCGVRGGIDVRVPVCIEARGIDVHVPVCMGAGII